MESVKGARYVVWPRIDQKSCLKAIMTAGFTPLVVENIIDGDVVRTDIEVSLLMFSDPFTTAFLALPQFPVP